MSSSLEELDVEEHCFSQKSLKPSILTFPLPGHGQWDQTGKLQAKLDLLDSERLFPVRRLVNLDCSEDSSWAQHLLEQLSGQLEEVEMWNVKKGHLMAVERMPNLRRLHIEKWDDSLEREPYIFQPRFGVYGLQFLHVFLPKETTFSLIAAHAHTLKELELFIGLKLRMNSRYWICKDLAKRLSEAGLSNISGIIVRRGDEMEGFHPKERCDAQIESLKAEFSKVHVYCDKCENIPW